MSTVANTFNRTGNQIDDPELNSKGSWKQPINKRESPKKFIVLGVLLGSLAVIISLIIILKSHHSSTTDKNGGKNDNNDPTVEVEYTSAMDMIELFQNNPDYDKYQLQSHNVKFQKLWDDDNIGGSVTDDVQKVDLNTLETSTVESNMLKEMNNVTSRTDRKSGYFFIRNVQGDSSQYYDVWIQAFNLTEEEYDNLTVWHSLSELDVPYSSDEEPMWTDVKPMLTGYARIINFVAYGTDSSSDWEPNPYDYAKNYIKTMQEGKFDNGVQTGYGRVLTSDQSAVGFYSDDQLYGKGIIFPEEEYGDIIQGIFVKDKTDPEVVKEIDSFLENQIVSTA